MRLLLVTLLPVVAGVAVLVGALALFQRRLIYPGVGGPRPVYAVAGTEAITVVAPDGAELRGLWRAPRPGCGVVVTFHGNASAPEFHAERFTADPWSTQGWGVLAIAYRGYPGSTGSPSEAGLIADGFAARREAASRAPGAPFLLHGHSLGAAVAIAAAEGEPGLGLYLEAPFDSLAHLVHLMLPAVPTVLLRDTWRSDRRIAGAGPPVFIVHGTADDIVPVKLGARLAAAAGPRARFEAIPGDHVSILGVRDAEAEALFRARIGAGCSPAGH